VLVNGSEGIGTGYSSMVPNYDVREIVENLKRLLRGEEAVEMVRDGDMYIL
jgi:DNA topoisomerase-2